MGTRPFVLPEDDQDLLRDRFKEGLDGVRIAQKYGVTKQAVYMRFAAMGHPFTDGTEFKFGDVLPWKISRDHMALDGAIRLRSHIRDLRGEELADSARRRLDNWRTRLRTGNVVLDYRPDDASPWVYVERLPTDGDLVVRWPSDAEPPSEKQQKMLARMK